MITKNKFKKIKFNFFKVILRASLDVLQYLLDKGSDVNEADSRNQTLLMQAALSDRPEVVQLLIKRGADIEAKNIYGHTAYDMAKNSTNKVSNYIF